MDAVTTPAEAAPATARRRTRELKSPVRRALPDWPARLARAARHRARVSIRCIGSWGSCSRWSIASASCSLASSSRSWSIRPPAGTRSRDASPSIDWLLAGLAVGGAAWPLLDFDDFIYHAADPRRRQGIGAILIVLVLEATRRTAGWILPFTAVCFLVYASTGRCSI